jgi:hypothetical protein
VTVSFSTTGPLPVNAQFSQSASTSSVCWPGTHEIDWVQIDIGDDSQDHLIKA